MGIADMIPGISGGTIAFLTGVYEPLSEALAESAASLWGWLRREQGVAKRLFQALLILLPIVVGMALGILTMLKPIQWLLQSAWGRPLLMALFLGLMVGSIRFCFQWIQWRGVRTFLLLLLGVMIGWGGSLQAPSVAKGAWELHMQGPQGVLAENLHDGWVRGLHRHQVVTLLYQQKISPETRVRALGDEMEHSVGEWSHQGGAQFDPYLIGASAAAICAMLLPGISGTYVLQLSGKYENLLDAMDRGVLGLLHGHFDVDAWWMLAQVACGLLLGAMFFGVVLRWVWERWSAETMAVLVGAMCGGIHVLWPWRSLNQVWDPVRGLIKNEWGAVTLPGDLVQVLIVISLSVAGALLVTAMRKRTQTTGLRKGVPNEPIVS